jgi:two-component system sensor histidine kinase GlrK
MRLTIFSRLMISYLTIFILVMIVVIYAILMLHQINTGTRHILTVDNRIIDYEEKLTDSILSQMRYEKKYVITKDHVLYDQFLSAKRDFNKYLSEALLIADTSEKRALLNRVKTYHDRFQSAIDKQIEQVRENQTHGKRGDDPEIETVADGILEALKKLEILSRRDIQERMGGLKEAGARASQFAIIMAGIALVLVIGISFLITRSITKPLTVLRDGTKEISKGVFDCEVNHPAPPEVSDLMAAFNSMCGKLKAVDKMKSDFFSSMSHELRTPLTSIKEGISLLQDGVGGNVSEKQKRLLVILSEESKRLIDLVNSLLDLSKMEAGMMTYAFEQGSIAPLIGRATTEITPLIDAKKITLQKKIDEGLPVIRMDREKILQVLRNLIGNAVKFTPERGAVTISARAVNRELEVAVSDTGPGITKENLTTIFEKFHQVSAKSPNRMKGTGLGLAIVRHVITAHGGRIWAESKPGHGSSFIFVLPV